MEIIVVDNCSSDGSVDYLLKLFPQVLFIANTDNVGFGKACNQGLSAAKGEYILFLNPDTLVPEDCITSALAIFSSKENIGALGIRMIDGKGRFLKESKRGFPSIKASFFKLSGVNRFFSGSRFFDSYYMGHLDDKKDQYVEVLAGAFMLIPRNVLQKIGGFDEAFFMYGEDIDLSYRIFRAGYKNYYLSDPAIIHFKGESTSKSSLSYVKNFYQAMSIFVNKHYQGSKKTGLNLFLNAGIWSHASLKFLATSIRPQTKKHTVENDFCLLIGGAPAVKGLKEQLSLSNAQYKSILPGSDDTPEWLRKYPDAQVYICTKDQTMKRTIELLAETRHPNIHFYNGNSIISGD